MVTAAVSNSIPTGTITSSGVGSGLDVTGIVSQLMVVQNQPIGLLQSKEASYQATLSNFGALQGALSQFQTALQGLNTVGQYQNVSASVANASVASATASSTATAGTYSLTVSQLAQAQTLVTAGQVNNTSTIGNGTITFDLGTISGGTLSSTTGQYSGSTFTSAGAGLKTVTIDNTNNSLTGIASAINAANIGVTATLVNDGSSTPNRLSITVNATGAASSLKISVAGDAALGNLLNQDPAGTQTLSQTSAAQNANLTVNGIAITKPTNTVSDVISGVSLSLASISPVTSTTVSGTTTTTPTATTVTVAQNTSAAVTSVNAFVTAYNSINSTISQATAYNSSTNTAGPLQGENSVLSIQSQIRNIMDSPVPGAVSTTSMLAQVGVSFQTDGSLKVDSTALNKALASNPSAVAGLFASTGTATDSLVSSTGNTTATKPGSYAVNITQLATKGTSTGSAAPTTTTISAGVNDTIQMQLDGVTSNVTLTPGVYTSTTLASALQSAINGNASFISAGSSVAVTQSSGVLTITSNSYGSKSSASITGGNGQSNLTGGGTATVVAGLDVAGTLNGVAGIGKGQTLTGPIGDASSGLSILINGGNTGSRGTVNYTQGYANELNQLLTSVLATTGPLAARTNGINATITGITNDITNKTAQAAIIKANYQKVFTALDVTMSQMTSTSSFLTQQLAALAR